MGLSRTDGRVLMTPYVLPGETALVSPVDKVHAELVQVEQASQVRIEPGCPYFGRCGGCHYQHAPYSYQLEQKSAILRETLRRVGGIEPTCEIEVVSGPEWEYRNRIQLHFAETEVGYLVAGTHTICPIDHCPISSPQLVEALRTLRQMAKDRRFPPFLESLELFGNGDRLQVNALATQRPIAKRFFDWCAESIAGYADGPIDYTTEAGSYRVGPRSFFQVNRFLIDDLIKAALGEVEGKEAFDLYAGVGLFSIPLSRRFQNVAAIESGASAAADFRKNAERNHARASVVQSPVDAYLEHVDTAPEFILADPPRAGLGKVATRHLLRLKAPRVHIVACDPATLARDLHTLVSGGYRIERLILVDLFPQTFHLETVVHLVA